MSGSAQGSQAARPARQAAADVEVRGVPQPAVAARGATAEESRASAERVSRAVAEQLIATSRRVAPAAVVPVDPSQDPVGQPADAGPRDAARGGRSRQAHRLRVGWHTASSPVLAGLTRPTASAGVLLGRGADGAAVRATLFRRTPVRMVLVGRHRLARLMLLRAAVSGARPLVLAGEPVAWEGFRSRLGATGTGMSVLWADAPFRLGGSVAEPLFVIRSADETVTGPIRKPAAGPAGDVLLDDMALDGPTRPVRKDADTIRRAIELSRRGADRPDPKAPGNSAAPGNTAARGHHAAFGLGTASSRNTLSGGNTGPIRKGVTHPGDVTSAPDDLADEAAGWSGGWWRCDAQLLPRVGAEAMAGLRRNDLLVTTRLGREDAERLCSSRLVGDLRPGQLTGLMDDFVVVVADGRARVVALDITPGEEGLLGSPLH
ncbi:hypothetical protein KIH74_04315 [Kineosporia sp. J2-2]|uniref:Uncharacterized protein n=1 Tax=Kineosporia corallincola TaxID=2835133 RepID=A0ABS5TAN8_9ACTN|nr:hypothetical protein [Kineosporia corallincola]MBT0768132.1 hypothetical protein [Kineosporia corallincola]